MIARHPNQFRKARLEYLEGKFKIGRGFTHITTKDKPIRRTAAYWLAG
jgi:hypothetical protein